MSENIDLTAYPEGFEAVLASLDFLPDDPETRTGYIIGYIFSTFNC